MPIDASPSGTLDIENATLRSREIVALTNMVAGNDVVRSDGPALEVYGDPLHGGNEARVELVSNLNDDNSNSFTRLTSNAGVFSIQSGTDASTNGPITFGGFSNERMRIDANGNVGIGTGDPGAKLDLYNSTGGADVYALKIQTDNTSTATAGALGPGIGFYTRWLSTGGVQIPHGAIHAIKTEDNGTSGGGLAFRTGNDTGSTMVTNMVIDGDGNVGIGITNPDYPLDVAGAIRYSGTTYNTGLIGNSNPVKDIRVNSGTLSAGSWYRIAKNGPALDGQTGGNRCMARFTIVDTDVAQHSCRTFYAGGSFAREPFFHLLTNTSYNAGGIPQKVRIVQSSGSDNEGIGIDIYLSDQPEELELQVVMDDNYYPSGFELVNFEANPVTTGMDVFEYNLDDLMWCVSHDSATSGIFLKKGGNVGIGKTNPGTTLDVNGSIRGSTVSCSRFVRNGDYRFGNGWNPSNIGASSFAVGFHDNDGYVDTIMLNTYADSSGGDANALTFKKSGFSARYYQQSFGSSNDWDGTGGSFRQFDLTNPSDDRLKENEEYITGAVDTLMKLKPQIYDLKYTLNSKTYERAAGVIVQDVWYDTPELRFLVTPGDLAEIPKEAPKRSDDPRDDPDYSKWGKEHAYLNYEFFIPYLIKGIQELVSELPRIKTQVSDIIPSTLDNYRGMLVSADTNEIKNGVPKLSLTNKSFDKRCFGVVSNSNTYSIDNEILVDTTGCGEVWVINTDNIKSGDFLTSSNVAGYAMKQNDDLLHNYTVAKSTMDCDFSPNNIIKKRVKQELTNVTYYLKEELTAINKEKYDAIEDDSFKKLGEEVSYYLEYVEVNETGEYDKMLYINKDHSSDMLSTDEWSLLDSNTQSEYIPKYYKQRRLTTTEYSELDENSKITNLYELETNQLYYHVYYKETKNSLPDYTIEDIRQEFMNVLDEHGQIQWEDDPSGATEKAYRIRYLDADGNITDEANAVHKAALVGCTYHCG